MSFSLNELLIFAARAGNLVVAEERIKLGADPNYLSSSSGSAGGEAVRRADIPMLNLIFEYGLTPTGPLGMDGDLIETALYHQHEEIAVYLAHHGFKLLPHSRSIYRDRLEKAFTKRPKGSQ